MISVEYKGASYKETSDGWIRDLVQEVKSTIFIDEQKLDEITALVKEKIEENLFHSKTYFGEAVEPNAPMTIRLKGHGKVFFDSGELYRSVLSNRISTLEREVFIASGRSHIAMWLQYGTKHMPARPFFGISDETLTKIQNIILKET